MFKTLQYTLGDDGVAIVLIDLPDSKTNVMSPAFRDDLAALVDHVAGDAAVRGVVLGSAKRDFMAGGDLKAMVKDLDRDFTAPEAYAVATAMSPVLRRLERCGKPFAAAIDGPAMGGGLELALACHHRLASDNPAVRLALPEVTLGLMPGAGGSQRLPRLIGIQRALPLMLQGTALTASAALEMGLLHAVVPAAGLIAAARRWLLEQGSAEQPWDRKGYRVPGGAGFQDAEPGQLFNLTATAIARDTQRNLPAPIALLTAVARGTAVGIDAGLHIEACEFAGLLMNPVAVNMVRTLFVSKGELEKLKRRPSAPEPAAIATVGVIGAGLMGAGIAQVAAAAGLSVVLLDASAEPAEAGRQRIADNLGRQVQKGRLDAAAAQAIVGRIQAVADYAALTPCELVVEAVFEDRAVKAEVYRRLQAVLSPDAIIASNTSALPITSLAATVERPERFIGLHFFSPVERMALVEVIRGAATDERTLAHALDFIKQLRKTPIIVNDAPGFFTTRVIGAYLSECMGMVAEGVSPVLIDNAARQAGFAAGPLALVDDLTIELGYRAINQQRADRGDDWEQPYGYPVQCRFVEELDRRGRRYGAGFYDYVDGQRRPWAGLAEVYPPLAEPTAVEELKTRMLYIQALEAARAFEAGVIEDPAEGDVGALLGIGFPAYTGGVFALIDTVGAATFIARCDELAERHGERYRPSAWLRERAAAGLRFYPRAA